MGLTVYGMKEVFAVAPRAAQRRLRLRQPVVEDSLLDGSFPPVCGYVRLRSKLHTWF
jgi:hypothetical protein